MVFVLHAGGILGRATTLEEDKRQGADQAGGRSAMKSIFLSVVK